MPGVSLSRITPPTVPKHFIQRDSILEILELPAPLEVVAIAPAGFGKTILAAQWAAMNPDCTIWYTPIATDDLRDLVFHCVSSLRRFKPDAAPWVEKYRTEEFNSNDAVVELANEIAEFGFTVNFIIDGAHKMNKANEGFTQLLADAAPKNVKTLTTSIDLRTITYPRAKSVDAFLLLEPAELRFTDKEVKLLTASHAIDYESNKELISKAQNWPAGLAIILKSINKPGRSKEIDTLETQIVIGSTLKNMDSKVFSVLEKLTYFSVITKEQARLILNNDREFKLFLTLASEGIYFAQADNSGDLFSVNEVIRKAFTESMKLEPDLADNIQKSSIAAKIATNDLLSAIPELVEVGATNIAKEVVGLVVRRLLWDFDKVGMEKCKVIINNYLGSGANGEALIDAFWAMAGGSLDELDLKVRKLEATSQGENYFEKIKKELLVLNSRLTLGFGNLSKTIELNNESEESHKSLFGLRMAAGAALLIDDLDELLKISAEAEALILDDSYESAIHLPAIEAMIALQEGRLQDALDFARYVMEETKKIGATGVWLAYDMAYCAAEVLREFCEEDRAIALIESFREATEKFQMNSWKVAFEAKIALIEAQQGRSTSGLRRIRSIREELVIPRFHHDIFRVVDVHELIIRSLLGDIERMHDIVYRASSNAHTAIIAAELEMHRDKEAAKILIMSLKTRNYREKLLFNILMVNLNLDKPRIAEDYMSKAMAVAINSGFRQIFFMQNSSFHELLLKYAASHPTSFMEQISKSLLDQMAKSAIKNKELEDPLTKRESEILNRLSTNSPISQIASNLNISENTIKTHLKNLYRKLDVNSRDAAVEKGRELLLL